MAITLEFALVALTALLLTALVLQTVRMRGMLREIVRRESRLEQVGCKDDLTGLVNRRVFQEVLRREIAQARRVGGRVGLAVLDVDDMKLINDGLGVSVGDEVLMALAERLAATTRESDTLARLGGDQFGLLISKCSDLSDILSAVYRLRRLWEKPLFVKGQELSVPCSVGLSVFPDDAGSVSQLLGHADTALAQAQRRGSNSLKVFDESSDRLARERLLRSQELRVALRNGELELYLQPQVSIPDGRLTGAEGLVRWHHPTEGLLSAGQFVPLAEQIGLMPELSTWVIEQICRRNAAWKAAGLPIVPISVNVSVRHFQSGDVPGVVAGVLERSGLAADYLHLEVTESAALHDVDLMTEQFERLRALGVGLQLDDFGTGYSSLSYLMRYPLNVLKIDRSFVTDVHRKDDSRVIVSAILAMAESLGLGVIAEGVETHEELDCLVEVGCRSAQGYLLGRPMPCERFVEVMERGRVALERPPVARSDARMASTAVC